MPILNLVLPIVWSRIETLDRKELEKIQISRLKYTLKRAYEKIPFYRKLLKKNNVDIDSIRTLGDLRKIPFTTKDDLRNNYPYGLLAVSLSEIVEVHSSSGTTGKPTVIAYTLKDIENWSELMARSIAAANVTKEDVMLISYSYHMFTGGLGFHYGALKLGVTAIPMGSGYTQRQVKVIKDLGVTVLASTPNYSLRIAEVAEQMGLDPQNLGVKRGIFGAEPWSEGLRSKIESTWGLEAYDIYGLSELYGPGVAIECERHEGLHVWEDHYIVEVVDPRSGEPLEPEEEGEIVITTLTHDAMPLIRYRTGDLSYIIDSKTCDCGRTHKRIGRIKGRKDDMLIINGVNVWPKAIEEVILSFKEVLPQYQIIIDNLGVMDKLEIVVEANVKGAKREKLRKEMREALKEAVLVTPEVKIVDPGSLLRTDGGKVKRVIDRRKIK